MISVQIELRICSPSEVRRVADLLWVDGRTTIDSDDSSLKPVFGRIVEEGLTEFVGKEPNTQLRYTPSSSSCFLVRFADYIRRQYEFEVTIRYSLPIK